jgi:hypothetical protein
MKSINLARVVFPSLEKRGSTCRELSAAFTQLTNAHAPEEMYRVISFVSAMLKDWLERPRCCRLMGRWVTYDRE